MKSEKQILVRRGVLVRLPKRNVCCFCREYIMPGQAYRFANIDPHRATITYLHGHVTCGDKQAKRGEVGIESGVTDAQILKFWKGMEVLNSDTKTVDRS